MTVAIPLFGERVSPHFSTARVLLVILAQERTVSSTMRFYFSTDSLSERKLKILSLGVDILVCGGIDRGTEEWLEKRGIRVISNTTGDAGKVLSELFGLTQRR